MAAADAAVRREELVSFWRELADCQKCPLAGSRTQVVFGTGNADAELMFVGEAPGFHEDQQGKPFVGRAGKLLDSLLEGIGLTRKQCFIANVLKCRPPGNRDPQPLEIDACRGHLMKQIELIQPHVICTLGNFATKLLSGRQDGISKVRGTPQVHELGGQVVFLYPIFHPAAALRTPAVHDQLKRDFAKLPALLEEQLPALERPVPPPEPEPTPTPIPEPTPPPIPEPMPPPIPEPYPPTPELVGAGSNRSSEEEQLGLF